MPRGNEDDASGDACQQTDNNSTIGDQEHRRPLPEHAKQVRAGARSERVQPNASEARWRSKHDSEETECPRVPNRFSGKNPEHTLAAASYPRGAQLPGPNLGTNERGTHADQLRHFRSGQW
jgi:hypothetical protein